VSGKEIIGLLLSRDNIKITERTATMTAERFDTEVIGLLPDGSGDIRITKEVVEAAAGNGRNGKEAMELLLSRSDIHITESAVTAVAHGFDAKVMRLLLGRGVRSRLRRQ
jgi:hypothetical protein